MEGSAPELIKIPFFPLPPVHVVVQPECYAAPVPSSVCAP
jgi:hypothetical protein